MDLCESIWRPERMPPPFWELLEFDPPFVLDAISRILIVDLLECILIKVYWTSLPMRCVLIDQLCLVGHLSALRKVIDTLGR